MTQTVPAAMTTEGLTAAGQAAAIVAGNVKLAGDDVQTVTSFTGAVASGTTVIPHDDTIPQITEGDQYLSVAITPTSATNILEIEAQLHLSNSVASNNVIAALFQDSTANALAAVAHTQSVNLAPVQMNIRWRMVAGTTSATTFKVRAGGSSAGTTTFNGSSAARIFGGVANSYIIVREIKV